MQTRRRKMRADPKLVVGYVRVSTDERALSPEAQRAAMEAWCERHDAEIVSVHEDIGVGGGTPVEKRPGLNMALHAAEEVGAGVILVAKRDRLWSPPSSSSGTSRREVLLRRESPSRPRRSAAHPLCRQTRVRSRVQEVLPRARG